VSEALATLSEEAVEVLAVDGGERVGVVTRIGLERFLQGHRRGATVHEHAFGVTELHR
jgi:hypothetical protein